MPSPASKEEIEAGCRLQVEQGKRSYRPQRAAPAWSNGSPGRPQQELAPRRRPQHAETGEKTCCVKERHPGRHRRGARPVDGIPVARLVHERNERLHLDAELHTG